MSLDDFKEYCDSKRKILGIDKMSFPCSGISLETGDEHGVPPLQSVTSYSEVRACDVRYLRTEYPISSWVLI